MMAAFRPALAVATLLVLGHGAAQAASADRCPAGDFPGFLASFARDPAIQRAHTQIPLVSETIDADAQPEPRTVRTILGAKDIRFPVMPTPAEQARRHMRSVSTPMGGDVEVKLRVRDTDEQFRLLFRRKGSCWTLVRKSDDSL